MRKILIIKDNFLIVQHIQVFHALATDCVWISLSFWLTVHMYVVLYMISNLLWIIKECLITNCLFVSINFNSYWRNIEILVGNRSHLKTVKSRISRDDFWRSLASCSDSDAFRLSSYFNCNMIHDEDLEWWSKMQVLVKQVPLGNSQI